MNFGFCRRLKYWITVLNALAEYSKLTVIMSGYSNNRIEVNAMEGSEARMEVVRKQIRHSDWNSDKRELLKDLFVGGVMIL
jgi:hypothetical protein